MTTLPPPRMVVAHVGGDGPASGELLIRNFVEKTFELVRNRQPSRFFLLPLAGSPARCGYGE